MAWEVSFTEILGIWKGHIALDRVKVVSATNCGQKFTFKLASCCEFCTSPTAPALSALQLRDLMVKLGSRVGPGARGGR